MRTNNNKETDENFDFNSDLPKKEIVEEGGGKRESIEDEGGSKPKKKESQLVTNLTNDENFKQVLVKKIN